MQLKQKVHLFFLINCNFRKGLTLVNISNKWYSCHGSDGACFCAILYYQQRVII